MNRRNPAVPTTLHMETMAYFKASEYSICGAKQKGHTFRSKIELAYNTIKKQQEEKEAQDLL